MKNKTFFIKGFLLFTCLVATLYYINYYSQNKNHFIYAIRDKFDKAKKTPSPKLLFVGGSSLAFGIDSKTVQDSLNIPVVNLGLHAGLGISFSLSETEMLANKGDIVVWSFEYYPDDNQAIEGDDYLKTIAYNALPEIYYYLPLREKINYLMAHYLNYSDLNKAMARIRNNRDNVPYPLWIFSHLSNEYASTGIQAGKFVYERKAFNEYGDVYTHLLLAPEVERIVGLGISRKEGYKRELMLINSYADLLKSRGVVVYFLFPCCAEGAYKLNKASMDTMQAEYQKKLKIPLLNMITDVVYPDTMFYNTVFHLGKYGRGIYTQKVIGLLKNKVTVKPN